MSYCYMFWPILICYSIKAKKLNKKNTCEIKFRRPLLNRMPIEKRGLVQLSFIHNLI